jgi:hypothetical protein
VETWWSVTGGPVTRPFSIMAHLIDKDGTVLDLADGLGVLPHTLAPGDVIVQRHSFSEPLAGTGVYLRTGAYWLGGNELWQVIGVPQGNALFLSLAGEGG